MKMFKTEEEEEEEEGWVIRADIMEKQALFSYGSKENLVLVAKACPSALLLDELDI